MIGDEKKKVKGHLDVPEFSFGELDDLQVYLLCTRRSSMKEFNERTGR